jgi:hypothetical protein
LSYSFFRGQGVFACQKMRCIWHWVAPPKKKS